MPVGTLVWHTSSRVWSHAIKSSAWLMNSKRDTAMTLKMPHSPKRTALGDGPRHSSKASGTKCDLNSIAAGMGELACFAPFMPLVPEGSSDSRYAGACCRSFVLNRAATVHSALHASRAGIHVSCAGIGSEVDLDARRPRSRRSPQSHCPAPDLAKSGANLSASTPMRHPERTFL
jgi:hypothetical protein